MIYNIYKQHPNPELIVRGCLSLGKDGSARAFDHEGVWILDDLDRAKVDWIQKNGMMLSGFEFIGVDKTGRKKYRYQEWFCGYVEDK